MASEPGWCRLNRWWAHAQALIFSALACAALASPCHAQAIDQKLWGVDPGGKVLAVAHQGSTLFIGGTFRSVGPNSGGCVLLDDVVGEPQSFPRVAGVVESAIEDGEGGWFIGGTFAAVGGLPCQNLAHIRADGSVDPWAPDPNGHVRSLARTAGQLLIGGGFTHIAGVSRRYLASVDLQSWAVTNWDPDPNSGVLALLPIGRTVLVGGAFTAIGGQARVGLASIDLESGRAGEWNPRADGDVECIAARGRTVYVGGGFAHVGGAERSLLAAIDINSGTLTAWNPGAGGGLFGLGDAPHVASLLLSGDRLIVGGHFATLAGVPRASLGAVELRSGTATAWNPGPSAPSGQLPVVSALAQHGTLIVVGGLFSSLGDSLRDNLASVDARDGTPAAWNPRANSPVQTLALVGRSILAGGSFTSVRSWVARRHLAAFDTRSGAVLPWNPAPDGILVQALAVSGSTVFVGGDFGVISGQPRTGLAEVDAVTGTATNWDAHVDGPVNALLLDGPMLYAAGFFSHVGSERRAYLAAIDAGAATPMAWNPSPNDKVNAIAASRGTIYVGGWFSVVGGAHRNSLAAIDSSSGQVLAWNPDGDGVVNALAVSGNHVFAGGTFWMVGGQPRIDLAALDATTGQATPWNPIVEREFPGPQVNALALNGNTLYVGGMFTGINGRPLTNLAALSVSGGTASELAPPVDDLVWSLDASGNELFVGGGFERVGLEPAQGLAGILAYPKSEAPLRAKATLPCDYSMTLAPNPARGRGVIRFVLQSRAIVSVAVYDLQGRRLISLLDHTEEPAGEHNIDVRTSRWAPGWYLCSIDADGAIQSSKLLVLP